MLKKFSFVALLDWHINNYNVPKKNTLEKVNFRNWSQNYKRSCVILALSIRRIPFSATKMCFVKTMDFFVTARDYHTRKWRLFIVRSNINNSIFGNSYCFLKWLLCWALAFFQRPLYSNQWLLLSLLKYLKNLYLYFKICNKAVEDLCINFWIKYFKQIICCNDHKLVPSIQLTGKLWI